MVFFVVLPLAVGSLASQAFRQILLAVRKVCHSAAAPELPQIIIHCVPELAVFGADHPLPTSDVKARALCRAVYDRILAPVDRTLSLRYSRHDQPDTRYFQHPSFALARPPRARNDLLFVYRTPRTVSLDTTERDIMLHVGYGISQCGKWGIAACVDEYGQAYDTRVWLLGEEDDDDSRDEPPELVLVTKVWDFALQFAKNADVEWRIVLTRLGALPVREVEGKYLLPRLEVHIRLIFSSMAAYTEGCLLRCYPNPGLPLLCGRSNTVDIYGWAIRLKFPPFFGVYARSFDSCDNLTAKFYV